MLVHARHEQTARADSPSSTVRYSIGCVFSFVKNSFNTGHQQVIAGNMKVTTATLQLCNVAASYL
jgi:hypothetical protein